MSRKCNLRQNFKVDTLLDIITNRNILDDEKNGAPNNFMTLMFLGFYDKCMIDEQFVNVEIVISKISQMKRKDSFKSQQDRVSKWNKFKLAERNLFHVIYLFMLI